MQYHQELSALADSLDLKHATTKTAPTALAVPDEIEVLFLLSVPNSFKTALLASARLLVYTPLNEHFGIVPLEAMLARTPVLAADKGGPTETVVDGQTGWLRDVRRVDDWAAVVRSAVDGTVSAETLDGMGRAGQERVKRLFSKEEMARRFEDEINGLMRLEERPSTGLAAVFAAFAGVLALTTYFFLFGW